MSVFSTASINNNYIKVRWQEPYVSAALNVKSFGITPPGIYEGFTIGPGSLNGRDVIISSGSVSGNIGSGVSANYSLGAYDSALGYSIAVYQDPSGFQETISIPQSGMPIHLDATGLEGQTVYVVGYVNYGLNNSTSGFFSLVNGAQIDLNPWYIVLGFVQVPASPITPLSGANFGYYDPIYPRTTPQVTPQKAGLMTPALLSQLQSGQVFPWNNLLQMGVDPNNAFNVTITPSQTTQNGIRMYSYIQASVSSRFPRNAAGNYNGGSSDNVLTTLNLPTGVIGGGHQVSGNTSFSIPSVSGTPNSFQLGIVSLDVNDNLSVVYGSIFSSLSGAMLDSNFPSISSALMQVGGFVISTGTSGQFLGMNSASGSIIWRRPYLNLGGGGSSSTSGTTPPSTNFTIGDNQSSPVTFLSMVAANANFGTLRYGIRRNGIYRRGTLDWAHDGSTSGVSLLDSGPSPTNVSDVGVSFSGSVSGSNFLIQYTSSSLGGVSGFMLYDNTFWTV